MFLRISRKEESVELGKATQIAGNFLRNATRGEK
jgi:hypothetical protein